MTMNTITDFSRVAARQYLESAVFIDDNIYSTDSGRPASPEEIVVRELKPAFVDPSTSDATPSAVEEEVNIPERRPFRIKDLIDSFAQQGIVCAPYEPEPGFATDENSVVFKLCETADLVILDWDFHEVGITGTAPKGLIGSLIKSGNRVAPHHIRLIAIYTNTMDLQSISNSIYQYLETEGCNADPVGDSALRLQSGATRILILGKDGIRRAADQDAFTVSEMALAERLLHEFADMNSGLLPSYALHGMAAIRRSSKRILERFHGNMNGAFLLHRAFSMGSEEAFDQLPALLAEELEAILDDNRLTPTEASSVASDAVSHLQFQPTRNRWYSAESGLPFPATRSVAVEVMKQILKEGRVTTENYPEIREINELARGFNKIPASLMRDLMAVVDTDNSESNERLATLFSNRTHYDESKRHLMYGTIIRMRQAPGAKPNWIYSFCLMPVCDSLRLDQSRQYKAGSQISFPFWKLREDILSDSNVPRRGIAVYLPDKTYALLSAGGKARDMLWMGNFDVNAATGTVTANRSADGRFLFTADHETEVEWIAELKPLHSQRIAHDIAQGLSRVGLVEAEWLRLLCDR
jgi:hypothetical protein